MPSSKLEIRNEKKKKHFSRFAHTLYILPEKNYPIFKKIQKNNLPIIASRSECLSEPSFPCPLCLLLYNIRATAKPK